jgi:hypothetical protein
MKKLIVGGVLAGGAMLVGAGLLLGAGIAKADTYGTIDDHDPTAYALELNHEGAAETMYLARDLAISECNEARRCAGKGAHRRVGADVQLHPVGRDC